MNQPPVYKITEKEERRTLKNDRVVKGVQMILYIQNEHYYVEADGIPVGDDEVYSKAKKIYDEYTPPK